MDASELVSRRTRRVFQEYLAGYVLREIRGFFEDEGLVPGPEVEDVVGERRGLAAAYQANVDWRDPRNVRKVLNVYESLLLACSDDTYEGLAQTLRVDGYAVENCRITGGPVGHIPDLPLGALADPSAIREHLERLNTTMDNDPSAAINTAKSLIESTCKLVLTELGEEYAANADVPQLVKAAQKALKLHGAQVAPTAPGADTVKRILSNLSQLAIGVAELRNLYGTGHGRTEATVGLGYRQAHLAVGSATVFCRLLLETLEDPNAPWKQAAPEN